MVSADKDTNSVFAGKKCGPPGNSIRIPAPSVPSGALQVPEDVELLRQIGRGDAAAFRTLVERHARYLHGVAYGLTGQAADAEDLVQETFAAVLNGRFRGDSAVRTWLVAILLKQVAMLRRSRRRRGPAVSLESELMPLAGGLSTAQVAEARLDLATMLQSLSPEHREVIVLRELEGLSYDEMARVLGVPVGTVESRLHRAREELRRRFHGYL